MGVLKNGSSDGFNFYYRVEKAADNSQALGAPRQSARDFLSNKNAQKTKLLSIGGAIPVNMTSPELWHSSDDIYRCDVAIDLAAVESFLRTLRPVIRDLNLDLVRDVTAGDPVERWTRWYSLLAVLAALPRRSPAVLETLTVVFPIESVDRPDDLDWVHLCAAVCAHARLRLLRFRVRDYSTDGAVAMEMIRNRVAPEFATQACAPYLPVSTGAHAAGRLGLPFTLYGEVGVGHGGIDVDVHSGVLRILAVGPYMPRHGSYSQVALSGRA
ncbi:hypothetical protein GGX14DRAFT_565414 [Mycena pura]|uniref:Uncharacterized protein n=1 Tax=Mycena pura TaxID=153505 RepID=A0AAD6YDN6_9AGAR|nr:hypothetical protein GGX14DRAFT_565414 [Mycena pura]